MILEHRGARPTIDPAACVAFAPGRHEELMRRQSEFFGAHREDRECG